MGLGFSYIFLDECLSEALDLAALTGILVPVDQYLEVRKRVNELVWKIMSPPDRVCPMPLELHGSSMLNDENGKYQDSDRVKAFQGCVDIVNDLKLRVLRSSLTNCRSMRKKYLGDRNFYGLNMFHIENNLEAELQKQIVQPVMDGVPLSYQKMDGRMNIDVQLVRSFSIAHHHMNFWSRRSSLEISISGFLNIAQPVFADSSTSPHLQLADVISYLLLQIESKELLGVSECQQFKRDLIVIAESIDPELLVWDVRKLN